MTKRIITALLGLIAAVSANGTYSDEKPTLTNAGTFRVLRGGNYYFIDTDGNRVY